MKTLNRYDIIEYKTPYLAVSFKGVIVGFHEFMGVKEYKVRLVKNGLNHKKGDIVYIPANYGNNR